MNRINPRNQLKSLRRFLIWNDSYSFRPPKEEALSLLFLAQKLNNQIQQQGPCPRIYDLGDTLPVVVQAVRWHAVACPEAPLPRLYVHSAENESIETLAQWIAVSAEAIAAWNSPTTPPALQSLLEAADCLAATRSTSLYRLLKTHLYEERDWASRRHRRLEE